MVRRSITMVAAAAVLVLGACGDDAPDADSNAPLDLSGLTFLSDGIEGRELVAGSEVSLAFDEATLSANAGCNTLGGSYTIEGDTLTLAGDALSTRMACDPELMEQDEWLTSFLSGGVEASLEGERLTLTDGEVTLELVMPT
jgi:heat shock protein HslJ